MKKLKSICALLGLAIIFSCADPKGTSDSKTTSEKKVVKEMTDETAVMVDRLRDLNLNGDPTVYYHWNKRLADLYEQEVKNAKGPKKMQFWFKYCMETLNSGQNEKCINEIEAFMSQQGMNRESLLKKETLPILELLALAYLRLGEIENCAENHNEYSCILPLREEAFHISKTGSENAIEIYDLIQTKFPEDKYKWLTNLSYMTLGGYPMDVPKDQLITFPNWTLEQKDFPSFKEIASTIGVGVDGLSGGVCLEDFNNDGRIDIFATSYGMTDQAKLFFNNGMGFDDVTAAAGLTGIVSGLNCIHADYDNDGDKDILILRGAWLSKGGEHPNSLLKNNGDGTFTDVTESSGLLSYHPTQTATWADIDRDGYLDLFIGNESGKGLSHPCELYMNQKDGTFAEEAEKYGLGSIRAFVKGVSFGDIDNDRWPDLYISVLGGRNMLYRNNEGRFEEIGKEAGVQSPNYSFPCWFWDVDNDGYQDIFVSGYDTKNLKDVAGDYAKELQGKEVTSAKPRLYMNNGDGTFSSQATKFGLNKSMYSMGANFGDLDNDGWLDFYVGTGAPDFSTVVPNRMFRNVNGEMFEEVTSAGRFGHIQKGHGIAFADLDRDGDQDIYAVMGGAFEGDRFMNVLFENPIGANNWVVLELAGTKTNKAGSGTTIEITLEDGRKVFNTVGSGGTFGASSLQAEIGLGRSSAISSIVVHWQNSVDQLFEDVGANKKYLITEGSTELQEMDYESIPFAKNGEGVHHHH